MGTHPIFESDFDCLTEWHPKVKEFSVFLRLRKRPKKILMPLEGKRPKKLKQAKDEAKAEILTFQKEREAQFKEKEAAIMGGRNNLQVQINQQTQMKINEMADRVNQRQGEVIDMLVASVQNIIPELPRNYVVSQGN